MSEHLLLAQQSSNTNQTPLGKGLSIEVCRALSRTATLYRNDTYIKSVDLADKTALRLFVIEAVGLGAKKTALATALDISRQSIHNYEQTYKHFGIQGLIHNQKPGPKRKAQQELSAKRLSGNKAEQLAELRRQERQHTEKDKEGAFTELNFSFEEPNDGQSVATCTQIAEHPYIGDFDSSSSTETGSATSAHSVETTEASDAANASETAEAQEANEDEEVHQGLATSVVCVVEQDDQLFAQEHDWQQSRYAGIFLYLPVLFRMWRWAHLIIGHFGSAYKIFMVFVLMAARNIRSIEQLKNVHRKEAASVLGIGKLPSKPKVWSWFYDAAQRRKSAALLHDYFSYQIRAGLVSVWTWFVDGHLLPYTGKEPIRYSYSTQRKMTVPGQTNFVTCDDSGRIVHFDIQEGKGDLRAHIKSTAQKWRDELGVCPVMVFDREGDGKSFFHDLVCCEIPFVTWEKWVDNKKLQTIAPEKYSVEFTCNGKKYKCFEETKKVCYKVDRDDGNSDQEALEVKFNLRRIQLWNLSTDHRTCGLANAKVEDLDAMGCAMEILKRWGASENTFKHLKERHPLHYHPGFKLSDSTNQLIDNPVLKQIDKQISSVKRSLNALYKKQTKSKETLTKTGKPRKNSVHQRIVDSIANSEGQLQELNDQKNALPTKVDASTLEKYGSLQAIDNEGKNLFDFVTCSVWNARKELIDWLRPFYADDRDIVDLFYAITESHGWVKSTPNAVIVRLEPLPVPSRARAQDQLCRKLTALYAQTPTGKRLIVEVGESPS